jgi:hypothetical protein
MHRMTTSTNSLMGETDEKGVRGVTAVMAVKL